VGGVGVGGGVGETGVGGVGAGAGVGTAGVGGAGVGAEGVGAPQFPAPALLGWHILFTQLQVPQQCLPPAALSSQPACQAFTQVPWALAKVAKVAKVTRKETSSMTSGLRFV
jgi:hypothetical protein